MPRSASATIEQIDEDSVESADDKLKSGAGEEARALRPLQAAAITYRIAFGPRAGQKMLTLRG